ncbi:sensor histidine kinase [Psychromonas hadalis]|uniref:sensor histidine kinase n=1 Tax=Psychromonas hadalis TaxID=211669 RepID=UPI0003B65DA9|nr:ATP-binding protein [Psychromonas hadalis]
MKSNLYSIFIFLIGLFATYWVSKHVQSTEFYNQQLEIKIQSQSISHLVQQTILHHAQQITMIANRWQSIEQINDNWSKEITSLAIRHPNLTQLSIYLVNDEKKPSIDKNKQLDVKTNTTIIRQARHLSTLPKNGDITNLQNIFMSSHFILENETVVTYLQAPIFIEGKLFAYLDAQLNISNLLRQQVATFQITHPFSLSEEGRMIHHVLPTQVPINHIKEQFEIPLLGHKWTLMVWPVHLHIFYQYVPFLGLVISILFALLTFFLFVIKETKRQLIAQTAHLNAINKDFTASKSKLVQSNKLSSLGEIATGIAHEINQPLQVICIHADMCQESLQKQDYRSVDESFRSILAQVERIEKIVKQVGSFGRDSEQDNYKKEVPATIFESVINIVINQYNQEDVELRQVLPPSLPSILCNKTQIEQVLVNLLINAKDAVEESEEKIVFIKAHEQQGKLYIEVSDSGSGIEPSKLDDIFTPFYTTKALGKGTGLGLSISYSIIHQHKGEFQVSSEIGKGSTFTVILPLD